MRLLAYLFVAVGFVLTFVAVYLIAHTGDKSQYMVVWGLGLLTIMLGFKSLPKKKTTSGIPFCRAVAWAS